jgi:predicted oxidoreductase
MAWSSLGGGAIFNPTTDREQYLGQTLKKVGQELDGAPIDQVAIAWLLAHPARIVPILGTGKIERIASAVQSERLHMTRQQWFRIWQASAGHEVP